jgi:hypothetical protein
MLTVSISINGEPIFARTVVKRLAETGAYLCDDGSKIKHDPDEGAVSTNRFVCEYGRVVDRNGHRIKPRVIR